MGHRPHTEGGLPRTEVALTHGDKELATLSGWPITPWRGALGGGGLPSQPRCS